MASGWNLWVWLVSVVVRRHIIDILIIIITFPYSTCISSFFDSIIPISLFIFKCFFVLVIIFLVRALRRSNFCQKPPSLGDPSMPRLQQLDPSGLGVVILKGELVFRCHDLPLLYS